ncbi:MAG: hypothetical protein LBD33_00240 [Puniceicoccales bacterium]|nr:hypothetical protein [Puniceicoccales bacterium]
MSILLCCDGNLFERLHVAVPLAISRMLPGFEYAACGDCGAIAAGELRRTGFGGHSFAAPNEWGNFHAPKNMVCEKNQSWHSTEARACVYSRVPLERYLK